MGISLGIERVKEAQSGPNPMDFSVTDNEDLNHERNRAEQERRKLAEKLEKTKAEYEHALASKNREVSLEMEQIKKHMEEQMHKERAEATRTSEHQSTIYNVRVTRAKGQTRKRH